MHGLAARWLELGSAHWRAQLVSEIGQAGDVLGVFGLLFGAAALGLRIALLSAGFSPDLG